MKFYHFVPASALPDASVPDASVQALMRGEKIGAIPTLCPTSDLMDYGGLTLYCQYERPLAFCLSQDDPVDPAYLKLNFEEKGYPRNQSQTSLFTLGLLTQKERNQYLRDQKPPKGETLVLWMAKDWERKQNRTLTGGTITLVLDDLVTVFQNNLMQVIDARRPHNAELYPDGKSKLEATRNIHAYASVYLKGYRKRFDQVLKDQHHTVINLMNAATLADFKREQVFVLTLKTITDFLGSLVDSYKQNQTSKELEETIVREVLALSKDKLKYSYL